VKILIHSASADSAGLAWMMQKEGASVDFYVKDKFARKVMSGIIPHVETIEEGLKNKPDFILFDLNGDGGTADALRKDGWRVVGGSALADKLEMDRAYGVKVAKQFGIKVPPTVEFKKVEEAIAYIKKTKKPLAIKVDNNKSEASSYVAKNQEDMLDYINWQKEEGLINGDTFILQEVVHGSEVSTEVWFSDGLPCFPSNSTWETKKLLAGELGVRTGCETSVVCHYADRSSRLAEQTVLKIASLLKYSKYTGPVDVNAIVSEDDRQPYFLEFTPRLGYSAIYAYCAMLGQSVSSYFDRVSRGAFTIPFKTKWSTSLKVHIPPYPFGFEDDRIVREVYGQTEGVRINGKYGPDFIPIDVEKGKTTDLQAAGTMGIIGECLGRGSSIMEAWRASQKVFESVECPNKGGRFTDGIEDAWKRISKLRSWGYSDIPAPSSGQSNTPGAGASKTPYAVKAPGV